MKDKEVRTDLEQAERLGELLVDIPHSLTPEIIQGNQADDSLRVGRPSAYRSPYGYS